MESRETFLSHTHKNMKYTYEVKKPSYDELFVVLKDMERLEDLLESSKSVKIADKLVLLDALTVIKKLQPCEK